MGRKCERKAKASSPTASERICNRCDSPFLSEGPWNRTCQGCKGHEPAIGKIGTPRHVADLKSGGRMDFLCNAILEAGYEA